MCAPRGDSFTTMPSTFSNVRSSSYLDLLAFRGSSVIKDKSVGFKLGREA